MEIFTENVYKIILETLIFIFILSTLEFIFFYTIIVPQTKKALHDVVLSKISSQLDYKTAKYFGDVIEINEKINKGLEVLNLQQYQNYHINSIRQVFKIMSKYNGESDKKWMLSTIIILQTIIIIGYIWFTIGKNYGYHINWKVLISSLIITFIIVGLGQILLILVIIPRFKLNNDKKIQSLVLKYFYEQKG